MLPTVFDPISFSGSRKSTMGRRAVLANNPEIDIPMPGQITPPRNSLFFETMSKLMVVPRSTTMHGPPYFAKPATAFTSRSAPTSRGLS